MVVNVWCRTRTLPIFTSQFHQQGAPRQIPRTAGHSGPFGRGALGLLGNWAMGPQRRLDIRSSGYRITVARQKAKARKGKWSAELLCHWAAGHFARSAAVPTGHQPLFCQSTIGPVVKRTACPLCQEAALPFGNIALFGARPPCKWAPGPLWATIPRVQWYTGPPGYWATGLLEHCPSGLLPKLGQKVPAPCGDFAPVLFRGKCAT